MVCLTQVALLLLLLGCFTTLSQADDIKLHLSTNTTTVQIDEPFTLRCDVANWDLEPNSTYNVWLCDISQLWYTPFYTIKVNATGGMTIHTFKSHTSFGFTLSSANYNQSSFTWTVIPHIPAVRPFRCRLNQHNSDLEIQSNRVDITTSPSPSPEPPLPPTSVTISLNSTTVPIGQPFTVHCDVANWTPVKGTTGIYRMSLGDAFKGNYGTAAYNVTVNDSAEVQIHPFEAVTKHNLTFSPASSNLSRFTWTVVPHTAAVGQFYCNLYNNTLYRLVWPGLDVFSSEATITYTASSPTAPPTLTTPPPASTPSVTI